MTTKRILDGVTVLDLTQFIAGPVTTRLMAEMGAEVIKVEMAPSGDQCRALPFIKNGRSAYFVQQNQGKKGIGVNMRDDRGREIVKALIRKVHVLVENFSPGVMARFGLDWSAVHAINPKLIMCSISAFGQTGPLANQPGFDFIAQAYTGVTSMIGDAGKAPPLIGVAVGDVGAAVSAVAAINGALFHQERHGGSGQYLDISLIDFYFLSHSINVEALSASAGAVQPTRSGSQHMHVAPCGVFKGRDRHIIILAVTQDMWLRLVGAMAQPELADDPRFRTVEDRMANRDALVQIIERWLQSEQKVAAALHTLQSARVPCAPVLTVAEAMAEPHLVERLTVRTIEDPTVGAFQIPGTPLRFSGDHDIASRRAPYLGEHNEEILTEELDYSAAAVRQLEAQGVLVSEPVPVDAATK